GIRRPAANAPSRARTRTCAAFRPWKGTCTPRGLMRLAVGLGIAFAACGCTDGGRSTHPRSPADDPMPTRATPVEDDFDEAVSLAQHITPPAEHPPSRSLGYLG